MNALGFQILRLALRVWAGNPRRTVDPAGFDHEPPSARACVEAVKMLRADRDALRAIIAGRDRAPTDAELRAHAKGGGSFRWHKAERGYAIACSRSGCEREEFDGFAFGVVVLPVDLESDLARGADGARWWPLDASGAPCAWPKETP